VRSLSLRGRVPSPSSHSASQGGTESEEDGWKQSSRARVCGCQARLLQRKKVRETDPIKPREIEKPSMKIDAAGIQTTARAYNHTPTETILGLEECTALSGAPHTRDPPCLLVGQVTIHPIRVS
jgi:hypothetical protein